jgi:hypothetical protein
MGGLAAGLVLGAVIPPTGVPTTSSMWQPVAEARTLHRATVPLYAPVIGVGIVAIAVVAGLIVGTAQRSGDAAGSVVAMTTPVESTATPAVHGTPNRT